MRDIVQASDSDRGTPSLLRRTPRMFRSKLEEGTVGAHFLSWLKSGPNDHMRRRGISYCRLFPPKMGIVVVCKYMHFIAHLAVFPQIQQFGVCTSYTPLRCPKSVTRASTRIVVAQRHPRTFKRAQNNFLSHTPTEHRVQK